MPDDDLSYMEKHPPSCVGPDVAPSRAELRSLIQGEYGMNTTVFGLRCACGDDRFDVLLPDEGFGLVSAKCVHCGRHRDIFDPLKHGYDGAVGNNQGVELGASSARKCPKCNLGPLHLAVGFQYSGEADILVEQKLEIKPEDVFGWFVLGGQCTSCGKSSILSDVECA